MKAILHAATQTPTAAAVSPASFQSATAGLPQRKCDCGESAGLDGECEDCRRKKWFGGAAAAPQFKLAVNQPGDPYEQEADQVADQVMQMPDISRLSAGRKEEPLYRKTMPVRPAFGTNQIPDHAEARIGEMTGGQPLSNEQQAFFEPRFGMDFSRVRIHADPSADRAARAVGARAFTRGGDIVFRRNQYQPHTHVGRRLLAHELTHVVQQGAAPRVEPGSANEKGARLVRSGEVSLGMANPVVQCWPGDGMVPPGDCAWARYLVLRGSVETAKVVVSTLGACSAGDPCLLLAAKIAAIAAEIAARVALDTTCFRGGDTGHRQQVQDKINMMNRCYRFFSNSNCPPELITAMAVVVEQARAVIAAAAVVVAIALVIALIAAIIALAKVIAALLAAAAAATAKAAAIGAAATAVIALLVLLQDELSSEDSSGA
jgi:hypothetical protein